MTVREFHIAGAILPLGPGFQKRTIGIALYMDAARASNQLFAGIENRSGKIDKFVPVESNEAYENFTPVGPSSSFHCDLHIRSKISADQHQVLCLAEKRQLTFFTRTLPATVEEGGKDLLESILTGRTFADYSMRGLLSSSMAKKLNDVESMVLPGQKAWKAAEISFFQRSSSYWSIIERSGFSLRPTGNPSIASFKTRDEMLDWIMRRPDGYLYGDESYSKWIGAWMHLSDFARHQEIIEDLGLRFAVNNSISNPDVLRVLRRIGADLRSKEAEGAIDALAQELGSLSDVETWTSREIHASLDLHKHVTNRLFPATGHSKLNASQSGEEKFGALADWVASGKKIKRRIGMSPSNQSVSFEWLVASSSFLRILGGAFPRCAARVAGVLMQALSNGAADLSYDEATTAHSIIVEDFLSLNKPKNDVYSPADW